MIEILVDGQNNSVELVFLQIVVGKYDRTKARCFRLKTTWKQETSHLVYNLAYKYRTRAIITRS